MRIIAKNEAAE
jgi:hypothetical protein